MFPKNKINIIYRILCYLCYLFTIIMINSESFLVILFVLFSILALLERSFRNIKLIILTIVVWGLCYLLNNYWLFKLMLVINYSFYYLDTTYSFTEPDEVIVDKNNYLRFKKKEKKGSNNLTAIYVTVHLVLLFVIIVMR